MIRRDYAMGKVLSCVLIVGAACSSQSKMPVKSYCIYSVRNSPRGISITFGALLALEGNETVVETSNQDDHVGDRTPMRVLLTVYCEVFLPEDVSITAGLAAEREDSCKAATLLMRDIDSGRGFSMTAQPQMAKSWSIRSIASDFGSLSLGRGDEEDVKITGLLPLGSNTSSAYDTRHAHVSWEYASGLTGTVATRIALAADCPAQ